MKQILCVVLFFLSFALVFADWSDDPAMPNLIAGHNGEQVLPKTGITPDGHTWIIRFDTVNGGYEVYANLYTPAGAAVFTNPMGLLISNHPSMSWLTDYDMAVDADGNAVIVWQDIRSLGVNNVVAYKISPQGNFLWGADGIAMSADTSTDFANMSPKVFCSNDNSSYVAWQRMGTASTVIFHRLSPTGEKLWGPAGITLTATNASCTWPQIIQADGNNVLLKYYVDSGPFYAPTRHMYIAKYDPAGTQLWNTVITNAAGISAWQQVLDFKSDGAGGGIIAWYDDRDSNTINDIYVQRVASNGQVSMPTNGALITADTANQQYYPKIAVDTVAQRIYAFYKVTDPGQTQSGVGRQLMDYAGTRLWGETGTVMIHLSSYVASTVAAYHTSHGAICILENGNIPSSDTSMQLKAYGYLENGNNCWDNEFQMLASTGTIKYHYDHDVHSSGWSVLAWEQGMNAMDIYAMRLNPDGSLGMQYLPAQNFSATLVPPRNVLLAWEAPNSPILPTSYSIFMNGELLQSVDGNVYTFLVEDLPNGEFGFFLIANYAQDHHSAPTTTILVMIVSTDDPLAPALEPGLVLYPNPMRSSAMLKFYQSGASDPARLDIYNVKGQIVFRDRFLTHQGWNEIPLCLSDSGLSQLSPGIYFLRLVS
ncbi:MAG: T9SS type A sorting domain-containing protein, partial [Candidatus Cloacimonadaceae bacterium]|nr:T9SS type A sorting domain-containing protein [Candidatus Cloacimonadaceae bacterium]